MNTNYSQLNNKYIQLLKQAENTLSRKDALALIHAADRIRQEMCSLDEAKSYPCYH